MNSLKKPVLALIFFSTALFVGQLVLRDKQIENFTGDVYAIETDCPPDLTDQECINFLNDQINQLHDEKSQYQSRLNEEQLGQLSLNEKISYYNGIIAEAERELQILKSEVEAKTREARIINTEIEDLSTSIINISQEVDVVQQSIRDRISMSYKSNRVTTMDLFFTRGGVHEIVRRSKYLEKTREHDEKLLVSMNDKILILNETRDSIEIKQDQVESKLLEIEDKRKIMEDQQKQLQIDKGNQQYLLAQSKKREEEFKKQIAALQSQEAAVSAIVTQIILRQLDSGNLPTNVPVSRGEIIGYQGHTGFAFGSHLHFSINGGSSNPFSGYLNGGGYYEPVTSGNSHAPLDGGRLTNGFHQGMAIDLQSSVSGVQDGSTYTVGSPICCYGYCVPTGEYNLRGEGAPVRSISNGKVSAVYQDACGGKYKVVRHDNGETSMYLHLK